jgi:hypothetical protein
MKVLWGAAMAALLTLQGCASITTGGTQNVSVEATAANQAVTGASCQLTNDKGSWGVVAPGTVNVRGSYGDLAVRCESEQFEPGIASFKSTTKPMAFGNILVGGIIGATIDVSTGAAYQYPSMLSVALGSPTGKPGSPVVLQPVVALPTLQVGDMWEYTVEDRYSGATRSVRWSVDSLQDGRASMNGGARVESLDGRTVVINQAGAGDFDTFEPPQGWGRPNLQLGQMWELKYDAFDGVPRSPVETQARVVRREVVQTPAGRFNTLVVEHQGSAIRNSGTANLPHRAKFTVWIDEASGRVVKFESDVFASSGSQPARISRERVHLNSVRRAAAAG